MKRGSISGIFFCHIKITLCRCPEFGTFRFNCISTSTNWENSLLSNQPLPTKPGIILPERNYCSSGNRIKTSHVSLLIVVNFSESFSRKKSESFPIFFHKGALETRLNCFYLLNLFTNSRYNWNDFGSCEPQFKVCGNVMEVHKRVQYTATTQENYCSVENDPGDYQNLYAERRISI